MQAYVVCEWGRPLAVLVDYWTALGVAKGLRPDDPASCVFEVEVLSGGVLEVEQREKEGGEDRGAIDH